MQSFSPCLISLANHDVFDVASVESMQSVAVTACIARRTTLGVSAVNVHGAGRVKTLHPSVHGGILALRNKPEHMEAIAHHGISTIDVVCCRHLPTLDAM